MLDPTYTAQVRVEALQTLRLANNSLAGPLPPLVESANLADISVAGNNLSGAAAPIMLWSNNFPCNVMLLHVVSSGRALGRPARCRVPPLSRPWTVQRPAGASAQLCRRGEPACVRRGGGVVQSLRHVKNVNKCTPCALHRSGAVLVGEPP